MNDTLTINRETFEVIAEVALTGAVEESDSGLVGPKGRVEYKRLQNWIVHLRDCQKPNCDHESHGTENIPEPWYVPRFE